MHWHIEIFAYLDPLSVRDEPHVWNNWNKLQQQPAVILSDQMVSYFVYKYFNRYN